MNMSRNTFAALFFCMFAALPLARADQWTVPTKEELAMTTLPEVPGASALYLYKEQTTEDSLHAHSIYVRLKVLTDAGKDYANVELPFIGGANGFSIDTIQGRTIHPDGTIIPFTGKPYDKLVVKSAGLKEKEKVFTLPAVEVGSIIEYRYKIRFDDNSYWSPDWFVQSDVFVRKAHYMWRPTDKLLVNQKGENISGRYAWAPILPAGVTVHQGIAPLTRGVEFTLDVHDILPLVHEDYMPPLDTLSYRVLFYYTQYPTGQEFWAKESKDWAKDRDKFIGPNSQVRDFVGPLVLATDTQQERADKLYAAVMALENTDFTRHYSTNEEHAQGLREAKNTDDILARKRGSGDQLAELYVAMARAAGLKAYLAGVSDRQYRFFLPIYLSLRQIDDYIALVMIDGKEVAYDPGQRYCVPGHLAWQHAMSGGIRQTETGAEIFTAPPESYKFGHVKRIGDLTLDESGLANGTITLSYWGDPALHWRQAALKGDDTSLHDALRVDLEQMLAGGMDIKVTDVANLADYTKPLIVTYTVKGPVGTSTGKRLMVPGALFEMNAKPKFSAAKREIAVDLHFPSYIQDAVRWKLPASLTVESMPDAEKAMLKDFAGYEYISRKSPNSISTFRNMSIGTPIFMAAEYSDLRSFYTKLENKDQESIVLTRAVPGAATIPTAKPGGN
jgi:hypothetical protein